MGDDQIITYLVQHTQHLSDAAQYSVNGQSAEVVWDLINLPTEAKRTVVTTTHRIG